jgi:hypothetical protein
MTLEEKFLPYCDNEYANREDNAANCAEEADEYAIDFARWLDDCDNYKKLVSNNSFIEILNIYKKENKL